MTVSVYRKHIFEEGSNAYGIARSERWTIKRVDQMFATEQEAKNFIRQESLRVPALKNLLMQWSETNEADRKITEEQVIDRFCFLDDTYLMNRRFFLTVQEIDRLKVQLTQQGIQLIESK